ncbi:hypothetical protein [Basilea psittacipulmonis]|uniref:Uncharacterized protein n=1 Tax=Basilea psittacipulmonis DSM 24701 TaxID=1072685 RepID=A0A077DG18_9BURK|nr:hypothetical protein [Basilea psittacipulmonis]AIL32382.1 hypothetical protein IX83_02775 [Basilea psittacipulmonis DSM 24701]
MKPYIQKVQEECLIRELHWLLTQGYSKEDICSILNISHQHLEHYLILLIKHRILNINADTQSTWTLGEPKPKYLS